MANIMAKQSLKGTVSAVGRAMVRQTVVQNAENIVLETMEQVFNLTASH